MATQKTILSIEVTNSNYTVRYSGGFKPDWDHLSEAERKIIHRHDDRLIRALLACPDAFNRIAGFVHAIERFKQREAKKQAKQAKDDSSSAH